MARYFADSQDSYASYGGATLGGVVRFSVTPAVCAPMEVTALDTRVSGIGPASRVWRQFHPGPVEPGTATLECLGLPGYSTESTGMLAMLSIGGQWGSVNYNAILISVTVTAAVGDLVRSTWEFKFN